MYVYESKLQIRAGEKRIKIWFWKHQNTEGVLRWWEDEETFNRHLSDASLKIFRESGEVWNGKSALKISSTFLPAAFIPCLYTHEFFTVQEQRGEQAKRKQEHWNKTRLICGLELHEVFISTERSNAQCHPHINSKELISQLTLFKSLISVFINKPCTF